MASEFFSLIYDGEEIRDGEMSVLALAPALSAMGELFEQANTLLNGSEATVETKVRADFRKGSFEILVHIHQLISDPNAALMPGFFAVGSDSLMNYVLGKTINAAAEKISDSVVEGLFKLLQVLHGRRPESVERDESRRVVIFNTGDNVNITVDQATAKLYENPRVRSLAARVGVPLRRPGIDELRISRDSEPVAALRSRDLPETTEIEQLANGLTDPNAPQQLVVQILRPAFVDGKWSVSDGGRRFQVDMEDNAFKRRVHAREVGFYDGDFYRVEMVTAQKVRNGKLATVRKIIRVIEPVHFEVQDNLRLSDVKPEPRGRRFRDE